MASPRSRRASAALLAGLLLASGLGTAGCLVALPIEEAPVEPNSPPFFTAELVQPSFFGELVYEYDPERDGAQLLFVVPEVGDENVEDRLFWRAFVDYDPATFAQFAAEGPRVGIAPLDPPSVLRRAPAIRFSVDPCNLRALPEGARHRIELIVTDRLFSEPAEGDVFPNQTLAADAREFRIVWYLRFDPNRCGL